MGKKVYLNGKLIPEEKACISINDRGFLYGDGIFESLRTYKKAPFKLKEHVDRLLAGSKILKINTSVSKAQIINAVKSVTKANKFKESYLKIILTRGVAKSHGLDLSNAKGKVTLLVTAEPCRDLSAKEIEKGWSAIISSIMHMPRPLSGVKSLNYLLNALALDEAKKHGADEAFMLDREGWVTEGTFSNIFIVKYGVIYTPPKEAPMLVGITRDFVFKLAKSAGMEIAEKNFDPRDLYNADEIFITSSGNGIIPVTKIWKKKVGSGKCGFLTKKLIDLYQKEVLKAG